MLIRQIHVKFSQRRWSDVRLRSTQLAERSESIAIIETSCHLSWQAVRCTLATTPIKHMEPE